MKISFRDYKVTVVVTPTDLRCGCSRLCAIAQEKLNIDVFRGEDILMSASVKTGSDISVINCNHFLIRP